MNINEVISKLNESIDELDLVSSRRYIEQNMDILNNNKNLLKSNARVLLDFFTNSLEAGVKPLNRQELSTIHSINTYASRFDLRGLKVFIKGKENLLLRADAIQYLNADAKIILEGMGAIEKSGQSVPVPKV
ncbi:hypothetical protein [Cytobacillus dafuensis]|uniref:Uncharacterized protein n=1 Tax=Cytobacillus dafuensis TaxID=1742359 RepID=A0A5B8Z024_CYTDA|nr:hypothetical protein [Cytobacillus dafuensis]QED46047.1 hypothetical protein FSZ17_01285 [Cytobacillus dafuensis]